MKLTIGNEEYELKYTLRALFVYERLMDKSYVPGVLMNDYVLLYSILLAVNENFGMTFDKFIDQCDDNPAIFGAFREWFLSELKQKALLQNQENNDTGTSDKKKD